MKLGFSPNVINNVIKSWRKAADQEISMNSISELTDLIFQRRDIVIAK